jgi:hypothetical protein
VRRADKRGWIKILVEEKAAAVAEDKEDVSKDKEAAGSVEDKEAATTSKDKETCAKVNWCERSKIVSERELALLIIAPNKNSLTHYSPAMSSLLKSAKEGKSTSSFHLHSSTSSSSFSFSSSSSSSFADFEWEHFDRGHFYWGHFNLEHFDWGHLDR